MDAASGVTRIIGWRCDRWLRQSSLRSALGLFLLARRAVGAFTAPLPAPRLLATAAVLCVLIVAVAMRHSTEHRAQLARNRRVRDVRSRLLLSGQPTG